MEINFQQYGIYCCPVNFKTAKNTSLNPFRIGV